MRFIAYRHSGPATTANQPAGATSACTNDGGSSQVNSHGAEVSSVYNPSALKNTATAATSRLTGEYRRLLNAR